jgi:hypothetical protein
MGTGLMAGGGIAGTLAALPMPLGSAIEPLSPRAFPGPGGMPLTPASWAGDLEGAARRPRTATASNAALPVIHPREKIETRRAWLMWVTPCRVVTGRTREAAPKFPWCVMLNQRVMHSRAGQRSRRNRVGAPTWRAVASLRPRTAPGEGGTAYR